MYGFQTQFEAQSKAAQLQSAHPENRYEVALHKHPENNIGGCSDRTITYGVKRYVPYIPHNAVEI